MTCKELLNDLIATADPKMAEFLVEKDGPGNTCDLIIAGDPNREVRKAAVTMFATHDVIADAVAFGADVLIVHEPVFYNDAEEVLNTVAQIKKEFIKKSGITIFRFHDYAHARTPDLIFDGEMRLLGLEGKIVGHSFAHTSFELDEPMTAIKLAKLAEEKLGVKHVRVAGCVDKPGTKISCSFGEAGSVAEELKDNDFYIGGEIEEWREGEVVRDYAQFGFNKAAIILTHEVSERAGMQLLAEEISQKYPNIESRYIESGSVYSYTD